MKKPNKTNKPKRKFIKRYLFAVSTPKEYDLLGVWGFSDKHVGHKLNRLMKTCDVELVGGFGVDREVDKFPGYCHWII